MQCRAEHVRKQEAHHMRMVCSFLQGSLFQPKHYYQSYYEPNQRWALHCSNSQMLNNLLVLTSYTNRPITNRHAYCAYHVE
jgi:hypothetical protein